MKVLVWQWGRRGAGPRFAADLAGGFATLEGTEGLLSLAKSAEISWGPLAPHCDLPMRTYDGLTGLLGRWLRAPTVIGWLKRELQRLGPDLAVCALPGPLDLLMHAALRQQGIPMAVIVHDADPHPGDRVPLQFLLQRALVRRADLVMALSEPVAARLRVQGVVRAGARLVMGTHPPFDFGVSAPAFAHDGPWRVLSFGRLLPYKGLDLLASCLRQMGPRPRFVVRVVGSGPESAVLSALRAIPYVTVENRWVPEDEVGELLEWADVVLLPYREASQSGVAAAALAAQRYVVATNVGGLAGQLRDEPRAILCEPYANSLADGLRRVLNSPPDANGATFPAPRAAWQNLGRRLIEQMHVPLWSGEA